LNHQEKSKPCVDCQKSAMAYFQTGKTPAKCLGCGGTLTVRPVNVTP
jgi:ribosomal protein S27E